MGTVSKAIHKYDYFQNCINSYKSVKRDFSPHFSYMTEEEEPWSYVTCVQIIHAHALKIKAILHFVVRTDVIYTFLLSTIHIQRVMLVGGVAGVFARPK